MLLVLPAVRGGCSAVPVSCTGIKAGFCVGKAQTRYLL